MTFRASVLPLSALVASAFACAACSDSGSSPVNSQDAGTDAAGDANVAVDASPDFDANPAADAATDGGALDAGGPSTKLVVRALSEAGHDRFYGVAYDAQGRVLAVGQSCPSTATTADCVSVVARFLADGSADVSFGTAGAAVVNMAVGGNAEVARGLVVTPDGKIYVSAIAEQAGAADVRERDVYLARFLDDGRIDTSFGTAGIATFDLAPGKLVGTTFKTDANWGLARDTQGRLYLSGSCVAAGRDDTDYAVLRLTATGARDASFASSGLARVDIANFDASGRSVVIDASGRAVMGGYYTDPATTIVAPVAFRLTPEGILDATFGNAGVFTQPVLAAAAEIYGMAFQGEKLVTAGYGRASTSQEFDVVSLRLTGAGTLDATYGSAGVRVLDVAQQRDQGRAVATLPDGRVIVVGGTRTTATEQNALVAVLTPNGERSAVFGTNGVLSLDLGGNADSLYAVAVAPGGTRAVAVGAVSTAASDAGVPDDDTAIVFLDLR